MAYATNAEILIVLKTLRPDITTIDAAVHTIATSEVNTILYEYMIDPTEETIVDYNDMLKGSEICFYLDFSSNIGMVESRNGDLVEEKRGNFSRKYNSAAPMFFFSTGSSRPFFQLLAHETFRMTGYKLGRAYCQLFSKKKNGRFMVWGKVKTDHTERGYGWDETEYTVI